MAAFASKQVCDIHCDTLRHKRPRCGESPGGVPMKIISGNWDAAASASLNRIEPLAQDARTSKTSAVGWGAVGAVALGPIGLLAALGARKKTAITVILYCANSDPVVAEVSPTEYAALAGRAAKGPR